MGYRKYYARMDCLKIRNLVYFSDFIFKEAAVFSQHGWNVRNVAPLAVRCCTFGSEMLYL